MSQQDPLVKARVSTLRSGFLAGVTTKAPGESAGGTYLRTLAGGPSTVPDDQQALRQPVIISTLNAPPPDETAAKDVTFKGATTTHNAASHIGSKKFIEYSWSKPVRDPELRKRAKARKGNLPAQSRMDVLSPEADRVSKSLDLGRAAAAAAVSARANASLIDLRADEFGGQTDSDADSPWLVESSIDSIGMEPSVDGGSVESMDENSLSDDQGYDSLGEAAESVVSIKDLLDRKKEELSEVEAKYNDVKQGKVKPARTARKKKEKEVPAILVANAIMQENLASELAVLKATLNVHSLTNQCGDHLHEIWGVEKSDHRRHSKSSSPDKSVRVLAEQEQLRLSDTAGFDTSSSMKVIKNEIRKVNEMQEAKMPKFHTPGRGLRLRSPRREHDDDSDKWMIKKRRHGMIHSTRSFKSKKNALSTEIVIKGPKLVTLAAGYRYDFSGLIELCETISMNTMLTSLDISGNRIQPEGVKKLLAPCLKAATGLLHLNLTRNDLRAPGMTALASALPYLSGLKSLVLADNKIDNEGATALAAPLLLFSELELLDLESNCISIPGLKELEPSLKLATQLQSLELSGNVTHFSHESSEGPEFMEMIMPALCELTNLTHLGLASNVLLTGSKVLARVLGDLRKSLVSLDLGGRLSAHNRVGPAGMKTLSAGLFWTPLVVLDMSHNDLGIEGAKLLALVLSIHTSLTEISLRGNGIGSVGSRALMGSLVKHQRIRNLNLADNDLNSEALTYVSEGLVQFTALERLCLAHNNLVAASPKDFLISSFSYDGMNLFTDAMLNSNLATQIHSLDLTNAGLDRQALRGMVDLVRTSSTLKVLNGLDFSPSSELKLPLTLDNYELLYVAHRLVEMEGGGDLGSSGREAGGDSLPRQRRKIDVSEFTSIDLSFCDFLEFPGVLCRLRNLREIDLSGNHLVSIPMATIMNFAYLHDIILRDCPLLLHPPRAIAAKGQVIEYLRECKLQSEEITMPLVAAGENDEILGTFMAPILGQLPKNTPREASNYKPEGTPRDTCKGKAQQALPNEVRWSPEGVTRKFSLIRVSGTARLASCSAFIQVQRALNVYVLRATGTLDRAQVQSYLDSLSGQILCSRAVVAMVIAHDGTVEEHDLAHRKELVDSIVEQWKRKLPDSKRSLEFLQPVYINTDGPETYAELGLKLEAASERLVPKEGDWVHPVVTRLQDELANIALRGHMWITWKIYFAKLNALLDEYDSPIVCVHTVTEALHAKGAIRCVGPTRDLETFEKPMLDTVFINPYKAADLMSRMPEQATSWKEWQVVEYLRSIHKVQVAWDKGGRVAKSLAKIRRLFSHGAGARTLNGVKEQTSSIPEAGETEPAGIEVVITTSEMSMGEAVEAKSMGEAVEAKSDIPGGGGKDDGVAAAVATAGVLEDGNSAGEEGAEEASAPSMAALKVAIEQAELAEVVAEVVEDQSEDPTGVDSHRSPREASLTPVEESEDHGEEEGAP